jgi:DNA-binding CsgD family transcriptional regulator
MTFSKSGDDPTSRRRLDAEAFARRDQRIWRMRRDGHTIQQIAGTLHMGLASVDRALKRLVAQQSTRPKADRELSDELDTVLAKFDDGGPLAESVTTSADVEQCNELEQHRLR